MIAACPCGMPPMARCSRPSKDIVAQSRAWCGVPMAPGSPVVVGAEAGEVFLWDAHTGEHLRTFADAPGSVLALDWSPCGNLLVGGDSDGRLRWWEVQS